MSNPALRELYYTARQNQAQFSTPMWLNGTTGLAWQAAHGFFEDYLLQLSVWGTKQRMPGFAASDALNLLGTERGLARQTSETDAAYGARLILAWTTWTQAGTALGLLNALSVAGYPTAQLLCALNDCTYSLSGGNLVTTYPTGNPYNPTNLTATTWLSGVNYTIALSPTVKDPFGGTTTQMLTATNGLASHSVSSTAGITVVQGQPYRVTGWFLAGSEGNPVSFGLIGIGGEYVEMQGINPVTGTFTGLAVVGGTSTATAGVVTAAAGGWYNYAFTYTPSASGAISNGLVFFVGATFATNVTSSGTMYTAYLSFTLLGQAPFQTALGIGDTYPGLLTSPPLAGPYFDTFDAVTQATGTTDPFGGTNAVTLTDSAVNTLHYGANLEIPGGGVPGTTQPLVQGQFYRVRIDVKAGTYAGNFALVFQDTESNTSRINFNATGTINSVTTGFDHIVTNATAIALPGSWWRYQFDVSLLTSGQSTFQTSFWFNDFNASYAGTSQTVQVYGLGAGPVNQGQSSAFWNTFAVVLFNVSNPPLDGSAEALRVAHIIQKWKPAVAICTNILLVNGAANTIIFWDLGWTEPPTTWNSWQIDAAGSNRATWDTVTTNSNATGFITWTPYNGA